LVDALGQALFAIPTISLVALLMNVFPKHWSLVSAALTAVTATAVADWASRLSVPHAPKTVFVSSESNPPVERRSRSPVLRLLRQWQFAGHGWPFSLLLVFVTEKAFAIFGLSRLTVDSFRQHDLNALMAITTTTATWVLFVEFAVQLRRKNQNLPNAPQLDRP
jgi:ABC-type dipeptide/oligopeptide/nickel transport system permease component